MKHVKRVGLAVAVATALVASVGAGTASATELLCAGGVVCKTGTAIAAHSGKGGVVEKAKLSFGGKSTECNIEIGAKTTDEGGAGVPVKGKVEALSFLNCEKENAAVTVLMKGTLEFHTEGANNNNNGTLKSTGTELTVELGGLHCIFNTNGTLLGTVKGSANTGGAALVEVNASLPRTGGKSGIFCGATGTLTGSYEITEPNPLNVK